MDSAIVNLLYGFQVAFEPHNLVWSIFGVLAGNLIGVLPGLGAITAIAILLPLTYTMPHVAAILMLAGIFYGSMYGGVIGAVLLNLPVHPQHAVTCLNGYPMAQQGRGGAALGISILAAFFASTIGILLMIFFSPMLVKAANDFGPAELSSIMLLGLVAGSTLGRGAAIKGIVMTLLGLILGIVGTDVQSGIPRFTFGLVHLQDGVDIVAISMGLFGVSEFIININQIKMINKSLSVKLKDLLPSRQEIKRSLLPILRGTCVGTMFGMMPGTGTTSSTFVAYALEEKVSKNRAKFGYGAVEGVAAPEAAAHAKSQVDFIPTMSLGIPGDPTMALLLGALLIQGIQPGPQLMGAHPDVFWGLIASFWVGNLLLLVLNIPLIGIWVKMLNIPYRYLVPVALFFIAIGCFATKNDLFQVRELLVYGVAAAILIYLGFSMAPVLLGYILGPILEENLRRVLLISNGDITIFFTRPISMVILSIVCIMLLTQIVFYFRGWKKLRGSTAS